MKVKHFCRENIVFSEILKKVYVSKCVALFYDIKKMAFNPWGNKSHMLEILRNGWGGEGEFTFSTKSTCIYGRSPM